MDGRAHPSPWQERIANGYVPPKQRTPEQLLSPAPMIVSENGHEAHRLRALAQDYTVQSLAMLAHISQHGRNESARVAACNSLLDRGWGKAPPARDNKVQQATKINVVFGNNDTLQSLNTVEATVIQDDDDTND